MSVFYQCLLAGFFVVGVFAQSPQSPSNSGLVFFEKAVRENGIHNAQDVLAKLPKALDLNFTLATKSESRQKGQRALLFNKDGTVILAVGDNHPNMEGIFADRKTGKISFHNVWPTKEGLKTGSSNPESCAACHTRRFVYIWSPYNQWPRMLGRDDDQESNDSKDYLAVRNNPQWKALFSLATDKDSKVFPYHSGGRERIISSMPNTQLTFLIGRRAALDLRASLREEKPALYQRYKYMLARALMGCGKTETEKEVFERDYEKEVASHWRLAKEIRDAFSSYAEAYLVLQVLGVNPDEIILTTPLKETSPKLRVSELAKQHTYKGGPLAFHMGDEAGISQFLLAQIWADLPRAGDLPLRDFEKEFLRSTEPGKATFYAERFFPGSARRHLDSISQPVDLRSLDRETLCPRLERLSHEALAGSSSSLSRARPLSKGH